MPYRSPLFVVLFVCQIASAQIMSNQIGHHSDLKYRSIHLGCVYVTNKITGVTMGTGFILKYNDKYFLATNYHILADREPWDTTKMADFTNLIPNAANVQFYNINDKTTFGAYLLVDRMDRRQFLSPEANKKTKSVVDIAFLPLDSIPKNATIDVFDLNTLDTAFTVKKFSTLYVNGFSRQTTFDTIFPHIDSVKSVDRFFYRDSTFTAFGPHGLFGASGGPVYMNKNNRRILVAMVSVEGNPLPNGDRLFYFLSLSTIINQLKTLSKNRQNSRIHS